MGKSYKFYRLVIRSDEQKLMADFDRVDAAVEYVARWCRPVVIHGKLVPTPVTSITITEEEVVYETIETDDAV